MPALNSSRRWHLARCELVVRQRNGAPLRGICPRWRGRRSGRRGAPDQGEACASTIRCHTTSSCEEHLRSHPSNTSPREWRILLLSSSRSPSRSYGATRLSHSSWNFGAGRFKRRRMFVHRPVSRRFSGSRGEYAPVGAPGCLLIAIGGIRGGRSQWIKKRKQFEPSTRSGGRAPTTAGATTVEFKDTSDAGTANESDRTAKRDSPPPATESRPCVRWPRPSRSTANGSDVLDIALPTPLRPCRPSGRILTISYSSYKT